MILQEIIDKLINKEISLLDINPFELTSDEYYPIFTLSTIKNAYKIYIERDIIRPRQNIIIFGDPLLYNLIEFINYVKDD